MTKRDAKRRVCAGAAKLLDNGGENEWLTADLTPEDAYMMRYALLELIDELRLRGDR